MANIINTDHLKTALEAVKTEIDGLDSKMSNTVGGYTWHMDTDKVYDRDGGEVGSLEECQTKDMTGTWFFARTSKSSTGSAAYPSKYTINGANGYLSLGDFVIWTGESLVHVSTYEAKASTVLNSDGQYSPKSGVDGMMSSTDKAYLTFLMEHYIAASMAGGFNSGNGTAESGLYGNVTLGRPTGSGDGDTYNMMSIRDKATNYTSQLLINENGANPYAYFRGRISGAWQRLLSDSDLISKLAVVENESDYPNWDTDIRIYHVKKWAAATADRPNSSWPTDGDYLIVNIPGAPNATTLHARTQFVLNNSNMETWVRFIPAYSGTGSFANGSPTAWTKLSDGVSEVNGHTVESDVPANAQFLDLSYQKSTVDATANDIDYGFIGMYSFGTNNRPSGTFPQITGAGYVTAKETWYTIISESIPCFGNSKYFHQTLSVYAIPVFQGREDATHETPTLFTFERIGYRSHYSGETVKPKWSAWENTKTVNKYTS